MLLCQTAARGHRGCDGTVRKNPRLPAASTLSISERCRSFLDWGETQLSLIDDVGLSFIQSQLEEKGTDMKGDPKVIAQMQLLLANELAAVDQYFIHSRL